MLQRIIAAVVVVLGVAAAGLAVGSATIWRASNTVVASATAAQNGTLIVTEPGVLDLVADSVEIRATAKGPVTVAVGRDVDVDGWVGDDPATEVTGLADWEHFATRSATPSPLPSIDDPATSDATATPPTDLAQESTAPDPTGSDMWIAEASGANSATVNWTATPGRWMLLVATTGEDPAPPTVSLSWHRTVTTPWLWPGIALGAVLMLGGVLWWFLRLRHPVPEPGTPGADAAGDPDAPRATEPEAITRVMTRREIREQEEAQRAAGRPRRNWLTGSIPIVPRERRPKTAAHPVVDTSPESRGDAWRRAWGMERDTRPRPVPPGESETGAGLPSTSAAAAAPGNESELPAWGGPRDVAHDVSRKAGLGPQDVPVADAPVSDMSPEAGAPLPRRRGRRLFTDDTDGGQQ